MGGFRAYKRNLLVLWTLYNYGANVCMKQTENTGGNNIFWPQKPLSTQQSGCFTNGKQQGLHVQSTVFQDTKRRILLHYTPSFGNKDANCKLPNTYFA